MDFNTNTGLLVPAVTAGQMREIDRIAVDEFDLQILQMKENAERNLCEYVLELQGSLPGRVVICAGGGGNGEGGVACVGTSTTGLSRSVPLDRTAFRIGTPAAAQLYFCQIERQGCRTGCREITPHLQQKLLSSFQLR